MNNSKNISRFTEQLSTPAKKLLSEEEEPFGRNFSEVAMRIILSIAESNLMEQSVSQIKEIALRPVCQFLQKHGGKDRTIREMQMKQAAFVGALVLVLSGLATIVSTKNFSTQH